MNGRIPIDGETPMAPGALAPNEVGYDYSHSRSPFWPSALGREASGKIILVVLALFCVATMGTQGAVLMVVFIALWKALIYVPGKPNDIGLGTDRPRTGQITGL